MITIFIWFAIAVFIITIVIRLRNFYFKRDCLNPIEPYRIKAYNNTHKYKK